MIPYHHFIIASLLAIISGAIGIIIGVRFLFAYRKDKKIEPFFMGICIFGIGLLFIFFFARALLPVAWALPCTIAGLCSLCLLFPFGAVLAIKLIGIREWKVWGCLPFLISFFDLGLLTGEVIAERELIEEVLKIGVGFYIFHSIIVLQGILIAIILLVAGLFFYFAKLSPGFLRKKALTLAIGSLLLLFLVPDLVGYGMDFLGVWRLGELCGLITLYYGFSLKPR
jgi:hypothetical protein